MALNRKSTLAAIVIVLGFLAAFLVPLHNVNAWLAIGVVVGLIVAIFVGKHTHSGSPIWGSWGRPDAPKNDQAN